MSSLSIRSTLCLFPRQVMGWDETSTQPGCCGASLLTKPAGPQGSHPLNRLPGRDVLGTESGGREHPVLLWLEGAGGHRGCCCCKSGSRNTAFGANPCCIPSS